MNEHNFEWSGLPNREDGEPCSHRGCLSHVSHPCEGCGRVGGVSGRRLRRGTQIAYIPMHADGDIDHPDVEFGFVTSVSDLDSAAFCRYWAKDKDPGYVLRTKLNSELTGLDYLIMIDSTSQTRVNEMLKKYCQ